MNKRKNEYTYELFSKYRPILLGIAILSILIFHYVNDCKIFNYNYTNIARFYADFIGSSGVDIFLFLSGLGLYYSWKKNNNYKLFLIKRTKRIIIPYLLISIPSYIIKGYLKNKLSFIYVLKGCTFYSFFTEGDRWFWYILMIMICYIIFPWIFNIVEDNKTKTSSYTTLLNVFTFISVCALMLDKYNPSIFNTINIMLLRFPIFIFGAFIGRASYEKRKISNDWITFVIISIICIPLLETHKIVMIRYILAALFMSAVFILIQMLEWCQKHNINFKYSKKVLTVLGKYSLEIYLTHVSVRSIMTSMGFMTCRIKFYLLMVIISFILSFFTKKITNKICKM